MNLICSCNPARALSEPRTVAALNSGSRLPDDDVAPVSSGDRAFDQKEIVLLLHSNDDQILNRGRLVTHVAGGAHAWKNAAGKSAGADGTRGTMEHRAVRGSSTAEMMTLDEAGKASPLAGSAHVHLVERIENLVDQNLVPHVQRFSRILAKLAQQAARRPS